MKKHGRTQKNTPFYWSLTDWLPGLKSRSSVYIKLLNTISLLSRFLGVSIEGYYKKIFFLPQLISIDQITGV